MTDGVDVLVVGNGIIGLSVADELSRRAPDLRVAIVGPSSREGGASRAAGAMLGCFAEVTTDTLASAPARAKFELSVAAHRRWPSRLEELDALAAEGEHLHRVDETHVILNGRSGVLDSENFSAILGALEAWDEPWEEVDPLDIEGMSPVPDARPLRALRLPREGAVDGNQILGLLERSLLTKGVTVVDDTVSELETQRGRVLGVRLDNGNRIQASTVLIAAGASSARLLRTVLPIDRVLPMYAGAGIALVGLRVMGSPFRTVVRAPNRSGSCGLHLIPLGGTREYLGANNVLVGDPETRTHAGAGHFLVGCGMEQLDQNIFFHRIDEWRLGNRPVTLDGFPVIGWTDVAGLYLVSGTYRDGFHCSPILAEHVADELLGGSGTFDLPFPPHRHPIPVRSVDEAVEEFRLHNSASWFEAGASMPRFVSTDALTEMFEPRVRALHDQLELDIGLPPEVLMFLLDSRKTPADVEMLTEYLRAIR